MSSELPPLSDWLKYITETIEAFSQLCQLIEKLIRQRKWIELLFSLGLVLASPIFLRRPIAFVRMVVTRSQPPKDLADRKAIKGLYPFDDKDAKIFTRLQRDRLLRDYVEVITNPNFRFGILRGESGCGKTSFLQAGVLPKLAQSESGLRGVYVQFSDQDPLATIQAALAKQLEIPTDGLEVPTPTATAQGQAFLALLEQAVKAADGSLVLFLDQFEQWYVHAKQPEDRQPFLQGLVAWYQQPQTPTVKIVVSIRYHLDEIQKALNFELGPQDLFELAKFTPVQAARVLAVISETDQLRFEEKFVAELAQELANRKDGLISPVDIQILAWMIRQTPEELQAFNREAFQRFGGVEGLLMRFLDQALMARVSEGQRQAAVKVLLALTDLERQVRAGVLTVTELQNKLTGSLAAPEVSEAVGWLARGDVRLITPIEREAVAVGYELAHERMIPALLRWPRKEVPVADKANQFLERWKVLMAVALLSSSLLCGWLWCTYTPQGLMHQVRGDLVNPLDRVSDQDAANAAIAFAKDGQWQHAFNIVDTHINRSVDQASFFGKFSEIVTHEGTRIDQAIVRLSQAQNKIDKIDSPSSTSSVLSSIAVVYDQFQEPKNAQAALEKVIKSIDKIDSPPDKFSVLSSIAIASGQLKESKIAQDILEKAIQSVDMIDSPYPKSSVLSSIATASGQLKESKIAQDVLEKVIQSADKIDSASDKSSILSSIATASGQLKEPKITQALLEKVLQSSNQIDLPYSKSSALSSIAITYGQLKKSKIAQDVLEKATQSADKIDSLYSKSSTLSSIAVTYGQLKKSKIAQGVLEKATQSANQIDSPYSKSTALSSIAAAYDQLKKSKIAQGVLEKAIQSADKIDSPYSKATALSSIAAASSQLKEPTTAQAILEKILQSADKIDSPYSKSSVLKSIAAASGQLKEPTIIQPILDKAIQSANKIDELYSKSSFLISTTPIYGQLKGSKNAQAMLEGTIQSADNIDSPDSKSSLLSSIAAASGQLKEPTSAQTVLEKVIQSADNIDDPYSKSSVLSSIATASGQLTVTDLAEKLLSKTLSAAEVANASDALATISEQYAYHHHWRQALQALRYCPESQKVKALTKILTVWAEQKNPKLIEGAVILEKPEIIESPGHYRFQVNLYAPTQGCKQYIDWWEILTEDYQLLDRPTFDRSHKDEQPFDAKSKPILIFEDQEIIIRAHMHTGDSDKTGYEAKQALKGSIKNGFKMIRPSEKFAANIAKAEPPPPKCVE